MALQGVIKIGLPESLGRGTPWVRSSRPLKACQLLQGVTPSEALARVPMIFALCGKAQQVAARQALLAAGARLDDPAESTGNHRQALYCEAVHEYLWRLLVDLPNILGLQTQMPLFAGLRRQLAVLMEPAAEDAAAAAIEAVRAELFGASAEAGDWKRLDGPAFAGLLADRAGVIGRLLTKIKAASESFQVSIESEALMTDRDILPIAEACARRWETNGEIIDEPEWQGRTLETGALGYQQQTPLLVSLQQANADPVYLRMVARIIDLQELLSLLAGRQRQAPRDGRLQRPTGQGLGWVKTARGLLLHHVRLQQGRVDQYRILAPTEWNFHPRGALYRALLNWEKVPSAHRRRWLDLQVLSLDPCVNYQLEADHA